MPFEAARVAGVVKPGGQLQQLLIFLPNAFERPELPGRFDHQQGVRQVVVDVLGPHLPPDVGAHVGLGGAQELAQTEGRTGIGLIEHGGAVGGVAVKISISPTFHTGRSRAR